MTLPAQSLSQGSLTPAPLMGVAPPPAPPEPVVFPLGWLLENASAPIQCRATTEVARLGGSAADAVAKLPYTYTPALLL
ncbi:MAG TPA: hypothetical protein VHM30_06240, partial [Gemmatimonadaceae bacterium]|nr:hypothetical protein [Gemmatimonadaceae bacterium]